MATIWLPERDFLFLGVFNQYGFLRTHSLVVSLLECVGVDVHGRGSLCMTQMIGHVTNILMVGIVPLCLIIGGRFTSVSGIMILNHGRAGHIVHGSDFAVGHKHLTQDQAWRNWLRQRNRHS